MPKAYSYARYSTPAQGEEAGGESLARQMSLARKWCAAQTPPVTLDEELTDEMSGSKGGHIGEGGALGGFLRRVAAKEIERHSFLIIETFSRLSRLPIDLASGIIADLVRADIRIVTLQTRRVYDRASLRKNSGELASIITLLEAAHTEAANRGDYGRWTWGEGGRRRRITYMTPAWIKPSQDRRLDGTFPPDTIFVLIDERVAVIRLIFQLYLSGWGIDRIVRTLNDPSSPHHAPAFMRPVKPGTKPKRKETPERGWYHAYVASILFTRRVLGEVEEAVSLVDEATGKTRSVKTGAISKPYPEAIDEDLWLQAQAVKRVGGTAGPTGEGFSNLFKGIAKCVCGESMWQVNKGTSTQYRYLLCANAKRGKCAHRKLHRYEPFEQGMLNMMGVLAFGDLPRVDDGTARLRKEVARKQLAADDAYDVYRRVSASLAAKGTLSEPTNQRLTDDLLADHNAKLTVYRAAQALLDKTKQAKPLGDQIGEVKRLVADMDALGETQKYAVRAKINIGLKGVLKAIVFAPDGEITLKFQHSLRDLPFAPDWHLVGMTRRAALIGRRVNGKLQMQGFTAPVTAEQYRSEFAAMKRRAAAADKPPGRRARKDSDGARKGSRDAR